MFIDKWKLCKKSKCFNFFFPFHLHILSTCHILMVKNPVTTALAINSVSCVIWKERADDHIGTHAPQLACVNWAKSTPLETGWFFEQEWGCNPSPSSMLSPSSQHCTCTLKPHKLPVSVLTHLPEMWILLKSFWDDLNLSASGELLLIGLSHSSTSLSKLL